MAVIGSKDRNTKWYQTFLDDRMSPKYSLFCQQAEIAGKLRENKFDLGDFGIQDDGGVYVKWHDIGKNIRTLFGIIFSNPLKPKVAPYEGENVEEGVSKICDSLMTFEGSSERGIYNFNPIQEMMNSVDNALWTGMGYWDARIDEGLADQRFYKGLSIYESMRPTSVVLDARANRFEVINHLHIVHKLPKDFIEDIFNIDLQHFGMRYVDNGDDFNGYGVIDLTATMREIVETQYLEIIKERLVFLTGDAQRELMIKVEPPGCVYEADLKKWISVLKQKYPDRYQYFSYKEFAKNLVIKPTYKGNWKCVYHVEGQRLHDTDYDLGTTHTLTPISFFPAENSPYSLGLPHYLKDPAALQMLVKTQIARAITSRQSGYYFGQPDDQFVADWEENNPRKLKVINDKLDEGGRISDRLMLTNPLENIQNMMLYSQGIGNEINTQFLSPMAFGEAPTSSASGKLAHELNISGTALLSVFRKGINAFLSKSFHRLLDLAAATIPPNLLVIIAAENDADRYQLIASGKFYERLSDLNVSLVLDLTTEAERSAQRTIISQIMVGMNIVHPTLLSFLGFDEPVKLARDIQQQQMQNNEALRIGTELTTNPALQPFVSEIQRVIQTSEMLQGGLPKRKR